MYLVFTPMSGEINYIIWIILLIKGCLYNLKLEDASLLEFVYLAFTPMPGASYCRQFRSLLWWYGIFHSPVNSLVCWFRSTLLCSGDVFWVWIDSLISGFYIRALGMFQIMTYTEQACLTWDNIEIKLQYIPPCVNPVNETYPTMPRMRHMSMAKLTLKCTTKPQRSLVGFSSDEWIRNVLWWHM